MTRELFNLIGAMVVVVFFSAVAYLGWWMDKNDYEYGPLVFWAGIVFAICALGGVADNWSAFANGLPSTIPKPMQNAAGRVQ